MQPQAKSSLIADRNILRGLAASERVRAEGLAAGLDPRKIAMNAALAAVSTAFDETSRRITFRDDVRRILRRGLDHPGNRARYREIARECRLLSLDEALVFATWALGEARARFQNSHGYLPRLPVMVLTELVLILRFLRRNGVADHFRDLVDAFLSPPEFHIAAE